MDDRENRIAKLPKWARDEIERLEADRDHYKAGADATADLDVEGTDTVLRVGGVGEPDLGLPPRSTIGFRCGEARERMLDVRVSNTRHGWGIRIAGLGIGVGLQVYPDSPNVIHVLPGEKL